MHPTPHHEASHVRCAGARVMRGVGRQAREWYDTMHDFAAIETYLRRVPGVRHVLGSGTDEEAMWWLKFDIDIDHPLAWNVVQEFANVLNMLSVNERLPAVFKPVSPPSYLNGGPREFLSWVIESTDAAFTPSVCAEWLEGRLPRPVDDLSQWSVQDDE